MRILIASPEAVPYIKTGGLADVAGALLKEFKEMKEDAFLVLPLYKKIKDSKISLTDTGISLNIPVGDRRFKGGVLKDKETAYFIACDDFFDRQELYGTAKGDYSDNAARFVFFSKSVLEMCKALSKKPDIIHCNDWQTGLIPLYLRTLYRDDTFFRKTATLLTIHNLGYQGIFPASHLPLTNLGWDIFTPEGVEFYGKVNFLKAGLIASNILNTVSETYAREILLPECGFGLDGVLKKRQDDLYGIVNGIDYGEWDPLNDKLLPANYETGNFSGKKRCKVELLKMLFQTVTRSTVEKVPLIGMIARFSEQKGMDLVLQAIPEIVSFGVKLVILGKGDERYQKKFRQEAEKYRDNLSVTIGFDDTLAHRIYAGSDYFLMPSKYEPCGLGQLIAMRYGTIPIVRKTGGLADTIQDFNPFTLRGTGFLFSDYTASGMMEALKRAFCMYTDTEKMQKMIINVMRADFSWKKSAQRYKEVYQTALRKKAA
jgi:starch synthase